MGEKMTESIVINLPKDMPLKERVAEVSRRLNEWLNSFDKPFKDGADKLQLVKCQQSEEEFLYQYSIISRKELSASDVKS
ncbi:MAG TPA: hypothetical protein ENF54_06490 [Desulfobacteraceae bacterium]|nr:hypothetical protein [Desulfobacteraceae bacterium]